MSRVPLSIRVTPEIRDLVARLAKAENRSVTNLIETLIIEHARTAGLLK